MHRGIPALAVILGVLILLGPLSLVGMAASNVVVLTQKVMEFNATLTEVVFNQTVSIAANGTYTINVTLPSNWSSSDVAAVHVVARGVSSSIDLTALDANGATLATATIVPLSTDYHTVLPANTVKIELAAQNAANATITVYVQSNPVQFQLSLTAKQVTIDLTKTDHAWLQGTLKQTSGPSGYVWGYIHGSYYPLDVKGYWGAYSDTAPPPAAPAYISDSEKTTGAGWSKSISIYIDASQLKTSTVTSANYTIYVDFYYDSKPPSTPIPTSAPNALHVASITLAGNLTDNILKLKTNLENVDWKSLGVGAVVVLVLGLVFLGVMEKGRKGRRGSASPVTILVLILVILAGAGLALGLMDFDLKTKYSLDPMYLGIGMLAMLSLILMFKAGYAKVPRIFKR